LGLTLIVLAESVIFKKLELMQQGYVQWLLLRYFFPQGKFATVNNLLKVVDRLVLRLPGTAAD